MVVSVGEGEVGSGTTVVSVGWGRGGFSRVGVRLGVGPRWFQGLWLKKLRTCSKLWSADCAFNC